MKKKRIINIIAIMLILLVSMPNIIFAAMSGNNSEDSKKLAQTSSGNDGSGMVDMKNHLQSNLTGYSTYSKLDLAAPAGYTVRPEWRSNDTAKNSSKTTVISGKPLTKIVYFRSTAPASMYGLYDSCPKTYKNTKEPKKDWIGFDLSQPENKNLTFLTSNLKYHAPDDSQANSKGDIYLDVITKVESYTKSNFHWIKQTEPYFQINKKMRDGMFNLELTNIGDLKLSYSFYRHNPDGSTGAPYKLKSSITYNDIDACQAMSFKPIIGACVAKNTTLKYGYGSGFHTFTDIEPKATATSNEKKAVGIIYDTQSLEVIYTSNQKKAQTNELTLGKPNGAVAFFGASKYSMYDINFPEPTKDVYDSDYVTRNGYGKESLSEKDQRQAENTIANMDKTIQYVIRQKMPKYADAFAKQLIFTDHLDTCLDAENANVKVMLEGSGDMPDDDDEPEEDDNTPDYYNMPLSELVSAIDSLDLSSFTSESVETLTEALNNAKSVLENTSSTTSDIEDAKQAVLSAFESLESTTTSDDEEEGEDIIYTEPEQIADIGEDITNEFTISKSNGKITATAKNPSNDKYYKEGRQIVLYINIKIKQDVDFNDLAAHGHKLSDYEYAISNTATRQYVSSGVINDTATAKTVYSSDPTRTMTYIKRPKDPTKTISDTDGKTLTGPGEEKNVKENLVPDETCKWTYKISQEIPKGAYYDELVFSDTFEDCLDLSKASIRVETSNGTNVTNLFTVKRSGQTVTAEMTAKEGETNFSTLFGNGSGDTVTMVVEIGMKEGISEETLLEHGHYQTEYQYFTFENDADVKVNIHQDFRNTGTVRTHIPVPNDDEGNPGLKIDKIAIPYEYQVGDPIPYTITIKNMRAMANSTRIELIDNDLPEYFSIDTDSLVATATKNNSKTTDPVIEKIPASVGHGEGIHLTSDFLGYEDTITIKFNGRVTKELNGTVIPNIAYGTAFGAHVDKDGKKDVEMWSKDDTSVYINSPKLNITKTMDKKPDADGKVRIKQGDTVTFKSLISNINAGTFMRNLYAIDTAETQGLILNPNAIIVRAKDADGDWETLDPNVDYRVIPYKDGEERVNISRLNTGGYTLDVSQDNKLALATSEEVANSTGEQLPKESHEGFIIKMLGKYRNLADNTGTIPATEDKRGKIVTYLSEALRSIEQGNGINYTTDYANLNLQREIEITYSMTAQEENIDNIRNFIRVPSTSNTNQDKIYDNDEIPSGGDFARTDEVETEKPQLKPKKEVDKVTYKNKDILTYTFTATNTGTKTLRNLKLRDKITSENAVYNKDFKVKVGDTTVPEEDLVIEYPTEYSVTISLDEKYTLRTGEEVSMVYTITAAPKAENYKEMRELIQNTAAAKADGLDWKEDNVDLPPEDGLILSVKVVKGDSQKPDYKLKDAEITVYDKNDKIAKDVDGKKCIGKTNSDGEVVFNISYYEGAKYYVKETKAPKGYKLNSEKFNVKRTGKDKLGVDNITIDILDEAVIIPPTSTPETPKTGDTIALILYIIFGAVLAGGIIYTTKKKSTLKK